MNPKEECRRLNYRMTRSSNELRVARWGLCHAKRSAKNKNLSFDLDRLWYFDEFDKGCALTGWKFSLNHGYGVKNALAPSIDRIDCNKGYTVDNCRLVLWCVNRALGRESVSFMYMWAKDFVKRMES